MAIKHSTGAGVLWLLLICLGGVPGSVHTQESGKRNVSKAATVSEDARSWFLAGREGGCAPTSILSRKGPEYSKVQSPYQLVDRLRAAGHKAELKELNTGKLPAVEIRAPSAGLAVLFVKKDFCQGLLAPPNKK
jgi:hypothetical protein